MKIKAREMPKEDEVYYDEDEIIIKHPKVVKIFMKNFKTPYSKIKIMYYVLNSGRPQYNNMNTCEI